MGRELTPGGALSATPDEIVQPDDLVRRAQRGEVASFESLYRAHAPAVHALCRRMGRDECDAGELVQDVFVRAWEQLASFRGQSAFGTWLHRLAVHVVLERCRSSAREAMRFSDSDAEDVQLCAPAAREDERMDMDHAIARLPTGARTVFVLHDVFGYTHQEIATMTGIAAATARVQLWRARRALTKVLDP